MSKYVVPLILTLLITCVPVVASAKSMPTCNTPRNTADSVFVWQRGREKNLRNASRCFAREGRNQKQLEESARRLSAVYNTRGALVEMDKISDVADYLDGDKNHRVVPHDLLPELVIEKKSGKWLWTKSSLDWSDAYYGDKLGWLDKFLSYVPGFLKVTVAEVALWQYLALLLLVSIGLLVRKLLQAVVAARLKQLSEKLGQSWTTKLVDVVASPGATLAVAIVLRLGYPQLRLPIAVSKALVSTVQVLITVSVVWAIYRCVDVLAAKLAERAERTESKLDDQLVPLIRKSLKVVVFAIGSLVTLQNLDVNVTALLASVSIGTLAFGLAAKDTLANLFGSISIFVDNPFQIGDWINVDGMDGTVEEVGFRSTRMRTFYDSVVVIPNAKLANAKIDNYGQRKYRRCFVTLGLTYDSSPEQVQAFVEGIRAIIQANELTRKDSYEVHFSGFGGSALEVMVYFFFRCDTWTDELIERHNVFLEFMRLAEEVGVSFAFPTQSLHLSTVAEPSAQPSPAAPAPERLRLVVDGFGPDGDLARPHGPVITEHKYTPSLERDRGESELGHDDHGRDCNHDG